MDTSTKTTRTRIISHTNACVSKLIVARTLLLITQNRISFGRFFEFDLCFFIIRILIRMVFKRKLSVGFLYFILASLFGNTNYIIEIFHFLFTITFACLMTLSRYVYPFSKTSRIVSSSCFLSDCVSIAS